MTLSFGSGQFESNFAITTNVFISNFSFFFNNFQPKDVTFEFPEMFDKEKKDDEVTKAKASLKEQAELHKKYLKRNVDSRGTPPWFSI